MLKCRTVDLLSCRQPLLVDAADVPEALRLQLAALDQARARADRAKRSARRGKSPLPSALEPLHPLRWWYEHPMFALHSMSHVFGAKSASIRGGHATSPTLADP